MTTQKSYDAVPCAKQPVAAEYKAPVARGDQLLWIGLGVAAVGLWWWAWKSG